MKENQNTEFKESWWGGYLRYVSAFCNADGGTLFIGIGDKGDVFGFIESWERGAQRINGLSEIEQKVMI